VTPTLLGHLQRTNLNWWYMMVIVIRCAIVWNVRSNCLVHIYRRFEKRSIFISISYVNINVRSMKVRAFYLMDQFAKLAYSSLKYQRDISVVTVIIMGLATHYLPKKLFMFSTNFCMTKYFRLNYLISVKYSVSYSNTKPCYINYAKVYLISRTNTDVICKNEQRK
jgi:hypothetical protein